MLDGQQTEIINDKLSTRFLATEDRNGVVNLAIVSSLQLYEDMLVFGNLFLWKTAGNLTENAGVKVLVVDKENHYFTVEGSFMGFEQTGKVIDYLNRSGNEWHKNMTGYKNAGKIAINAVSAVAKVSSASVLMHFILSRLTMREQAPGFPYNVAERFAALKSIKAVAFKKENSIHIQLIPALNMSDDYLFGPVRLPRGRQYAACVIAADQVAFQVKGVIEPPGLRVDEVYASGPPVAGKRIYPLEKPMLGGIC